MKMDGLIRLCGLDYAEAAAYLQISRRQVRAWCEGQQEISDAAILKLTTLYRRQADAVDVIIDAWARAGGPNEIQVEMPTTSEEAMAQGWPCLRTVESIAAAVQLEISPARLRVLPKTRLGLDVPAHDEDRTANAA